MSTPDSITDLQLQTIRFIAEFQRQRGYAPTLDEISEYFHRSRNTLYARIKQLVVRQFLKIEPPRGSRNIALTPRGWGLVPAPRHVVPLGVIGEFISFPEPCPTDGKLVAHIPSAVANIPPPHITTRAERI